MISGGTQWNNWRYLHFKAPSEMVTNVSLIVPSATLQVVWTK